MSHSSSEEGFGFCMVLEPIFRLLPPTLLLGMKEVFSSLKQANATAFKLPAYCLQATPIPSVPGYSKDAVS